MIIITQDNEIVNYDNVVKIYMYNNFIYADTADNKTIKLGNYKNHTETTKNLEELAEHINNNLNKDIYVIDAIRL